MTMAGRILSRLPPPRARCLCGQRASRAPRVGFRSRVQPGCARSQSRTRTCSASACSTTGSRSASYPLGSACSFCIPLACSVTRLAADTNPVLAAPVHDAIDGDGSDLRDARLGVYSRPRPRVTSSICSPCPDPRSAASHSPRPLHPLALATKRPRVRIVPKSVPARDGEREVAVCYAPSYSVLRALAICPALCSQSC
jgi:hypothetical protein